ncbi:MAG: hypothetical protein B6D55_01110 [Candidatus Omnitrophica bacterium 4484_70.2]|nr:MAG: hypothetical protein B6D55_01110 [Candidatus Omnitrophica bacterium 4484_70.2]
MLEQLLNFSNYHYNLHAIPLMLVSIFVFSTGLFIFLQAKKSIKNVSFFLLCVSLSLWLFTMGFVYLSKNPQIALLWYKYFTFFGVVSIMPTSYLFSSALTGLLKKQRYFVIGSFLLSFLFYILAITTDKFITSPRLYFWGYYPRYEPPIFLFLLFYLISFIAVQSNLWFGYKRERVPIKKNQVLITIIGFTIGFIASIDFVAKIWPISLYPFGFIPIFILTCLIAYSIIRYRAFDIETVIHKTVLWILSFFFIIIPIFFLYRWIFPYLRESLIVQLGFWIISFVVFTIYLRLLQPRIDDFFQRRKYNLEEILSQFTEDLVHLKGINKLIKRIEDTIANTLYPQRIDIFIYDEGGRNYKLVNIIDKPKDVLELKREDPFLLRLAKNDKIVYREFAEIDPNYTSIREKVKDYFNQTNAVVAVPLVLDGKLLGIINLSRKTSLRRYSALDFHFLTVLKNESAIAISNSLLYEEMEEQVRQRTKELVEVQKQLIQAEKLATMGTLAGGVAHEINNPLVAILTNVQMLLASNTIQDESDRESLQIIEEATYRCRSIVKKLMTYARRPAESTNVSPVNLLDVIKSVISFLGYQLEQENIKIVNWTEETAFIVYGNYNELEQVVTNLILNARDAIKKNKNEGEIYISLSRKDKWVEMKVRDEGVGIPENVLPKIFDPFFTTKEVGKGLGLGLSICQAIVERCNGRIDVESKVEEGSCFTIRLPCERKEVAFLSKSLR